MEVVVDTVESKNSLASDEENKRALKVFFQQQFGELLLMGVPRANAAAEALLDCKHVFISKAPPSAEVLTVSGMESLINAAKDSGVYTPIVRIIGKVFSNPDSLIPSFLLDRQSVATSSVRREGISTTSTGIPVDVMKIDFIYRKIVSCENEGVRNSVAYALDTLSNTMRYKAATCTDGSSLIPLVVILEMPEIFDPRYSETLRNLISGLDSLKTAAKIRLLEYVCNVSEARFKRHVELFQRHISARVSRGAAREAKMTVALMSIWVAARHVFLDAPVSMFYNATINEEYMSTRSGKRDEYLAWRTDIEAEEQSKPSDRAKASNTINVLISPIPHAPHRAPSHGITVPTPLCCIRKYESLVSYPFVLSPGVKASILEIESARQMQEGRDSEMEQAVATGSRYVLPYLVIRIRRSHMVEDAINQFAAQDDGAWDLKKPLKVVFDGEEGVDEGGVRKEFYQLVTRQLLDPGYGMFKKMDESRCIWFNSDSLESDQTFELIGILVGVAIYNSVIINLNMPSVVYKKLKNKEPTTLEDLKTVEPSVYSGLQKLLDFEESSPGDVERVFDLRFELTYEVFGAMKTAELMEGGSGTVVTAANRELYVDLYVKYLLDTSIKTQFDAFARGFHKVCGGNALDLFESWELELLICGNPTLDFAELEKGTVYDDGYNRTNRVIEDFWAVLHSFDEDHKKRFLKFLTGSDRSPIDGLSKLRVVISKNGSEDTRLPSAHTCFNHLLLPEYSSREILRKNIIFAITEGAEGFGLR